MAEVRLPNGYTIYPRESVPLGPGVVAHVERWHLWIETPEGWFMASADSFYRDDADGIYFDSLDNHDAIYDGAA